MNPPSSPLVKVWGAPIALAILTLAGLLFALFGKGAWHWASWFCLAIPLGTGVAYWLIPRQKTQ